jgi:hypothetical protein
VFKWFWFTNAGKEVAGNVQKQDGNFYYDCGVTFFQKAISSNALGERVIDFIAY